MANFVIGTTTLVVALVILLGMAVFIVTAGPTTSARLNIYCLMRRSGWKKFIGPAIALAAMVACVLIWQAALAVW